MLPDCKPVIFLQSLCMPAAKSRHAERSEVAEPCLAVISDVAADNRLTPVDVFALASLLKELAGDVAVTRDIFAEAARDCRNDCGICKAVVTDPNWNQGL